MDDESSFRSARGPQPVGNFSVDLRGAQGVLVGRGRQHNVFHLTIPRSIRNAVLILIIATLLAGGGWIAVTWVLPQFAPTYKTQFLIDTTAGSVSDGPETIANSLKTVVENSGDHDALALRSFGGECGAEKNNTTQLVDFGTDNRQKIPQAASEVRAGSKATLLRGITQAVEDFSQPFAQRAKQVNRIIVVTRHGTDACDWDTAFVEREIRDRIAAAGVTIEFRLIGYQVPDTQRDHLTQIATGAGAPDPMFVNTPADLNAALDWFTNIEPILQNATEIIDLLNHTVEQLDIAVTAIKDRRLDVAERILSQAKAATDTQFEDLQGRIKTPTAQDIYSKVSHLRTQQALVVAAADLLTTARAGAPQDPKLIAFGQVARVYNTEVNTMNETLDAPRATAPRAHR